MQSIQNNMVRRMELDEHVKTEGHVGLHNIKMYFTEIQREGIEWNVVMNTPFSRQCSNGGYYFLACFSCYF
jgi:hypothetical protein